MNPSPRIDFEQFQKLAPKEYAGMYTILKGIKDSGLNPKIMELINVRASQINGCAFCLGYHIKDAVAAGWTERELLLMNAWREVPSFTKEERVVLDYVEHVTRIYEKHVPEPVYHALSEFFSPEQIVHLTYAITVINSWNRLMIAFEVPPLGK
jgi:AhpD family alkylhydroperoxidase